MFIKKKIKIAVGLSGGVDSSVVAALLKEQGYDVLCLYMATYSGSRDIKTSGSHACYGPDEDDIESARSVCQTLGIPLHVIDLRNEFKMGVIRYFKNEYLKGRTPNPCIICNRKLKFGFLLEKAKKVGLDFDFFATGHYARVIDFNGRFLLGKAADLSKDQSYFLHGLSREQLASIKLPLGDYSKKEVRELAESFGLTTAHRPESQDFFAGNDYSPLFSTDEVKTGDIVDENGIVLGRHRGIIHYTTGQRKGLGIASSKPLFVKGIDAATNRIIVGNRESLFSEGLVAREINLIALERFSAPIEATVKIRLRHEGVKAVISPLDENRAMVTFDSPQASVAPGQSAVFYLDHIVLGGGVIEAAF